MDAPGLSIDFMGDVIHLEADDVVGFGRNSDIVVDESNPFMHRVAGSFGCRSGVWWLDNVGTQMTLIVIAAGGSRAEVAPGASVALSGGETRIAFEAGRARYELLCTLHDPQYLRGEQRSAVGGATTTEWGAININYEQRQLLVALAEPRLSGNSDSIPTTKQLVDRLGWTPRKVERKLDYLCGRFTEAGVSGLRGSQGADARLRRLRLAEHVTRLKIVAAEDLELLDLRSQQ